jgi:hypothetical protein
MPADYLLLIAVPVAAAACIGAGRWLIGAIRRSVADIIRPEIERIHQRIDEHMEDEELSIVVLTEVLAELTDINPDELRGRLERRRDEVG